MTKFSNKFQKTVLALSNFEGKKKFLGNLALTCKTSHEFLALCQNSEKYEVIPRKCLDRQKDRRMDRQTYII